MFALAVINESTAISDGDVKSLIPAFERQWNQDVSAVWGVGAATFRFVSGTDAPPSGSWWIVFLDDGAQGNALAYHDLTNDGLPMSKIFTQALLADRASLSVGASHEICSMAVDPWLNRAYQDRQGAFWAVEVCDPVADDEYAYDIGGILVSDFVTPRWFEAEHAATGGFDIQKRIDRPFQVLDGGYAQTFDVRQGWTQVTGLKAAKTRRGISAARGSRRERRARGQKHWLRSNRYFETRESD